MKKIFFGIAMMLSAIAFTAAAAPSQGNPDEKQCPGKEQCQKEKSCKKEKCDKKQKCDKKGKKSSKKGDMKFGKHHGKKHYGKMARHHGKGDRKDGKRRDGSQLRARLFDGITLNADQQQQIAAIDAKMKADRQQVRAKIKEVRKEAKEMSAQIERRAKEDAKTARQQSRKEYNDALQKILTAEQYDLYVKNAEKVKARPEKPRS